MLDSEIRAQSLSKENKRLRARLIGAKILIYALATALFAFIFIAAELASRISK